MPENQYLSIGEVLGLLLEDFPDVTISKIRFLESQGLIEPERTPSGYRKFYEHDVERLRTILHEQKANFLPLKVIRDRIESGAIDADAVPRTPPRGIRNVDTPEQPQPVPRQPRDSVFRRTDGGPEWAEGRPFIPGDDPVPTPSPITTAVPVTPAAPVAKAASASTEQRVAAAPAVSTDPNTAASAPRSETTPSPSPTSASASADASTAGPTPGSTSGSTPAPDPSAKPAGSSTSSASTSTAATAASSASTPTSSRTPSAEASPSASSAASTIEPTLPSRSVPTKVAAATKQPTESKAAAHHGAPKPIAGTSSALPYRRDELCTAASISEAQLTDLENFGLIASRGSGSEATYPADALDIARVAGQFLDQGIDARHLRAWRQAAEREAALFEQRIMPLLRQRNPQSRQQALDTLAELAELGNELRAALVASLLRHHFEGG